MPSRPLTAADLGINEKAVEWLAGRVMIQGQRMTVRIENIRIFDRMRGRISVVRVLDKLEATARESGMKSLVIEGLSVGNTQLARILVRRHGAVVTPQRTLVITRTL